MASMRTATVAIHWFRKGLRLRDNPALLEACSSCSSVYPVFIIDPHFCKPDIVGINRYNFLLESLHDLDRSLRSLGSRLFVIRGKPEETFPLLFQKWDVNLLTYEADTEPYALLRDVKINELAASAGVTVSTHASHTLHDMECYMSKCPNGNIPRSYGAFQKLFGLLSPPRKPVHTPEVIPPPVAAASSREEEGSDSVDEITSVPTLEEMGYGPLVQQPAYPGGETEALRRLRTFVIERPSWVAEFEKPNTIPNSLEPSTTVLSPYLKFGCLSASTLFYEVQAALERYEKHTLPPVSLHGQLLWREFFYLSSVTTVNFDRMEGNPQCRQVPWERNQAVIAAWKEARTGFPFIDAIMTQLREEGWIHHLARHAVACFLTRGDLWQHWEEGAKVFDLYLLDADWALNNANWQWLSCSNFFYQYFRCYSPVAFGKKADPSGHYIRKWLPQLRKLPDKYIYEPWTAPRAVQESAGCVVGVDYPRPIVEHQSASKANMEKMKAAYSAHNADGSSSGPNSGSLSRQRGMVMGEEPAGKPKNQSSTSQANSIEASFKKVRKGKDKG